MKQLLFLFLFITCKAPEPQWESLIKNNSLQGWHIFQDDGSKNGWRVENEILIFDKISGLESGDDDSSLLSNKQYSSFEISFEWKIEPGGNSGFMWGVSEAAEYRYPYQTGPEVQIIDPSVYLKPTEVLGGDIELNNILSDLEISFRAGYIVLLAKSPVAPNITKIFIVLFSIIVLQTYLNKKIL